MSDRHTFPGNIWNGIADYPEETGKAKKLKIYDVAGACFLER